MIATFEPLPDEVHIVERAPSGLMLRPQDGPGTAAVIHIYEAVLNTGEQVVIYDPYAPHYMFERQSYDALMDCLDGLYARAVVQMGTDFVALPYTIDQSHHYFAFGPEDWLTLPVYWPLRRYDDAETIAAIDLLLTDAYLTTHEESDAIIVDNAFPALRLTALEGGRLPLAGGLAFVGQLGTDGEVFTMVQQEIAGTFLCLPR